MNTQLKSYTLRKKLRHLRVIKGGLQTYSLEQLATAAWNFSYTCLWNGTHLSVKEIQSAKQTITEIFAASPNPLKACVAFCERVLLARYYVTQGNSRYIPLPSIWLDSNNEKGFAGTKKWHDDMKAIRASLPDYRKNVKALAEAVTEFSDEASTKNYQYWTAYFMERNATTFLQLFQTFAAHHFFS